MKKLLIIIIGSLTLLRVGIAQNIDLATVPTRDAVQLTIYNSEDITLVREKRRISFKRGANSLQFSWSNTLIDPTSVELRFPGRSETLEVRDTTYPHTRPQLLIWNVHSDQAQEAEIEISYFTSGITWSSDYIAIADASEKKIAIEGFVKVTNHSGEDYANAEVRLVVGTINLVERIAELAQLPIARLNELDNQARQSLESRALRKSMQVASMELLAPAAQAPKEVKKQSLSDYFIYSIEGTETIPHGWSKRLNSFSGNAIPLVVKYRYRPREYGDQLIRLYTLRNDSAAGLGTTPLPDGQIRVFRSNGHGGLSYLSAQAIPYVPIGDAIELNLGADPEVVFELVKLKVFRDNLWLKLGNRNVYHSIDKDGIRVDRNSRVSGWDEHALFTQRIRNYSARPIAVEIRRSYDGDVAFQSDFPTRLHDFRTVEFAAQVAPGQRADLLHQITRREGFNSKQNRVEVQNRKIDWQFN